MSKNIVRETLSAAAKKRGVTIKKLCPELGIHYNTLYGGAYGYTPGIVKILNERLGVNIPLPPPNQLPAVKYSGVDYSHVKPIKIPHGWLNTLPREIRPYIEQEYMVNPERARHFAANARTYDDIKELRREIYRAERPTYRSPDGLRIMSAMTGTKGGEM